MHGTLRGTHAPFEDVVAGAEALGGGLRARVALDERLERVDLRRIPPQQTLAELRLLHVHASLLERRVERCVGRHVWANVPFPSNRAVHL